MGGRKGGCFAAAHSPQWQRTHFAVQELARRIVRRRLACQQLECHHPESVRVRLLRDVPKPRVLRRLIWPRADHVECRIVRAVEQFRRDAHGAKVRELGDELSLVLAEQNVIALEASRRVAQ